MSFGTTRLRAHGQKVLGGLLRAESDGSDDMVMSKRVKRFSRDAIPDLPACERAALGCEGWATNAVKSALPVTARDVSREIFDDHTAPL